MGCAATNSRDADGARFSRSDESDARSRGRVEIAEPAQRGSTCVAFLSRARLTGELADECVAAPIRREALRTRPGVRERRYGIVAVGACGDGASDERGLGAAGE